MTDSAPPTLAPAATAAHPGRSPPSPRTSPRLTGAPPSTARRACVSSPKQTATQSASLKTPSSPAGWSRSPPPADALTPSTSPAPPPSWTAQLARSSATTTPATNPANASSSAAATAAQPSARPAPASTQETPIISSGPVSSEARTFPRPSVTGLGCSSRSLPLLSARSTGLGNNVDPAEIAAPVNMGAPLAAAASTPRMPRSSANRSAPVATTTQRTSFGTRTPPSCGTAS